MRKKDRNTPFPTLTNHHPPPFGSLPPPPTPNPVPPPPPATMTSKPVKLCLGSPDTFNGSFLKVTSWFKNVSFYLAVNPDIYSTDAKKIMFALSYMPKDTPSPGPPHFAKPSLLATPPAFSTWTSFETKFKDTFELSNTSSPSIHWLSIHHPKESASAEKVNAYATKFQNDAQFLEPPLTPPLLGTSLLESLPGSWNASIPWTTPHHQQ